MHWIADYWLLAAVSIAIGVSLLVAWRLSRKSDPAYPYEPRRRLLTRSELRFQKCLRAAVDDEWTICPMVRMADILRVRPDTPQRRSWLNRILAKHVDFVLCEQDSMRVVLAIELDDDSHQRPDRVQRDEFVNRAFDDAGLPLLRIPVADKYDAEEIREWIDAEVDDE